MEVYGCLGVYGFLWVFIFDYGRLWVSMSVCGGIGVYGWLWKLIRVLGAFGSL